MVLTITQIMQASLHLAKPYVLSEVMAIGNGSYYTIMSDPDTDITVPICWSDKDDEKYPTEEDKIDMVEGMIENAIDAIKMIRMERLAALRRNRE